MAKMDWVYFRNYDGTVAFPVGNIQSLEVKRYYGESRACINGVSVLETFSEAIEKIDAAYAKYYQ